MARKKRYPEQYSDSCIEPEADEVELVSKSQMKREMHHLQALGEALLTLKADELAKLQLSAPLQDALAEAAKIKHREGLRRQMQFIGKLMRKETEATIAEIETLLDRKRNQHRVLTQQQHKIEQWRDTLLAEANTGIEALMEAYPQADRQWLRQTVRQAKQEQTRGKAPTAARKLFAYIRDLLLEDNN